MLRMAQLLYLMLPVYCANMAPPFVKYWPWWNRPIAERALGSHKTVVGFGLGVTVALAVAFLQSRLDWHGALVDYERWPVIGAACGVGALGGDALKSAVKRRAGIAPGARWIPADQLDFVAGGLLALWPFVRLAPLDIALIVLVTFVGDLLVNRLAYVGGIRGTPW